MSKKKALLTVLAMVLVCVMSVMGTLAYLQMSIDAPVKNTFVAAGGGNLIDPDGDDDNEETAEDNGQFVLAEHVVTKDANGNYSIAVGAAETTTGNSYDVMPGMELPKDPFIRITEKTSVPAYLYIEVVEDLDEAVYDWSLESHWAELKGVTGPNGGKVYVYGSDSTPTILNDKSTGIDNIGIIAGDKITVANEDNLKLSADENNPTAMEFYAYLAQASVGSETDAAVVFNTCFGN